VLDGNIERYYAPMGLRDRIATPEGKRRYVRTLFATIADRYDFITVALSFGRDRRWKRRVVNLAQPGTATRVLDLATGTGDLAFAAADRGAAVVGLDVTYRMIQLAHAKRSLSSRPARPGSPAQFVVGDMLALPFAEGSFEIVTTGYGLRNVPDLTTAIAEIHRVLVPGGQLLSLDFNRPSNTAVRTVYLAYLTLVGSALGWMLHRDPDTYRYIPASIRQYPGAEGVARMLAAGGFATVRVHPVLGGLMTIHHAIRT
jgi:demethylmenaquinone methyltransferase/2-methoxy-6-polyprenyl-1,4-benzoquinol methylase